ncbi:hypothetical protein BC829DRAFT_418640 [Chytridium lagenaria]|nr:hypothetical protein BC829DRAFT_418640 [Chytridium lagenaria]
MSNNGVSSGSVVDTGSSIRLTVAISHSNPKGNIFNCQELLSKQNPPLQPPAAPGSSNAAASSSSVSSSSSSTLHPNPAVSSTSSSSSHDVVLKEMQPPQPGSQRPPRDSDSDDDDALDGATKNNDYDVEDDFIDDSELFYQDGTFLIPTRSNYGYFAWRGPVENFFEEHAPEVFESPKPSAKKKKTAAASKSKKAEPKITTATIASSSNTASAAAPPPTSKASDTVSETPMITEPAKTSTTAPPSNPLSELSTPAKPLDAILSVPTATSTPNGDKKRKKSPAKEDGEKKKRKQATQDGKAAVKVEAIGTAVAMVVDIVGPTAGTMEGSMAEVGTIEEAKVAMAGTNPEVGSEGEKKKRKKKKESELPPTDLHPDIMDKLALVRTETSKHTFENKRHFPPVIKPLLFQAAWVAVSFNALDSEFIRHLREFLPYNAFTLKKLTVKMLLREGITILQRETEKLHLEIQAKVKELCTSQGIEGPNEPPTPTGAPPAVVPEGSEDNPEVVALAAAAIESATPKKKFKWTEDLRIMLWNLLTMECELAEFYNHYHVLEGDGSKTTDMSIRKAVYAKLHAFWPQGWMTTIDISREYSSFKRKMDRKSAVLAAATALDSPKESLANAIPIMQLVGPINQHAGLAVTTNVLKAVRGYFPVELGLVQGVSGVPVAAGKGGKKEKGEVKIEGGSAGNGEASGGEGVTLG